MVQGTVYRRYILSVLAGKAGNTHINYCKTTYDNTIMLYSTKFQISLKSACHFFEFML